MSCNSEISQKKIEKKYQVIDPNISEYINLKSKSGKIYTMPFSNLTFITENNIMDYCIGNNERIRILTGDSLLPDERFQFIDSISGVYIYKIDSLSPDSVLKKKFYKALKENNYFGKEHILNYSDDIELIYYAVEMGFSIITIDGDYYWRYGGTVKDKVKEIKCENECQ